MKKNSKKTVVIVLSVLVVFLAVGTALYFTKVNLKSHSKAFGSPSADSAEYESSSVSGGSSSPGAAYKKIDLPLELDGGRITVKSVFPFTGLNPDCENKSGTDIAALQIENTSSEYLENAELVLTLNGSTEIKFRIADLPPHRSVMVCSYENTALKSADTATGIECSTEFCDADVLMSDRVNIETENSSVTVTNISDADVSGLTVICRCIIDDYYFGGISYSYSAGDIKKDSGVTVNAADCFLGKTDVVRVKVK